MSSLAKAIAAALGKLPQLTSLTLNLDGNSVGASGAKAIEAARRQVRLNLALARLEGAEHTNNANGREERDQPGEGSTDKAEEREEKREERVEKSEAEGEKSREKRDERRDKRDDTREKRDERGEERREKGASERIEERRKGGK